jgi:iron-sulfur cluster assembly protein
MIHLTNNADIEFRRLLNSGGKAEALVKVGVDAGGCSGLQYCLEIVAEASPTDLVYDHGDGLRVACDRESLVYLEGLTIDFANKLVGGGFRFTNPNASRSCGCGTSFRI